MLLNVVIYYKKLFWMRVIDNKTSKVNIILMEHIVFNGFDTKHSNIIILLILKLAQIMPVYRATQNKT